MKVILIYFIVFFSYNIGVCQNDMNVGVRNESGELVVYITYDGMISSGMTGGLPTTNDYISDFTITLKWPNSANVNLDNTINSTLGANTIIKVNAETIQGLDEYQRFRLNSSIQLPSNFLQNTPYEIFRISYSSTNSMSGDNAQIAGQGYLPVGLGGNNQPNTSIDYGGTGDVVDFLPMDIVQAAPLPITIKTFSATKDGERSSRLDWTSSSEINSDFIAIERSTDGEDWTTIGQVKAAGNSNRDIDYIYYDRSLPMARSIDNIFYYRLRLTDLDGQYEYSETRGVNLGRLEGLVSIYPNPATDIINVDLTDMDLHEGIIHLSVYDNTGKAIISKEVNGAGIEPIQASNMAAGSYQVVVKQGDTTHRKQIIVVN